MRQLILLCFLIVGEQIAMAQSTQTIHTQTIVGIITDESGQPMEFVTVSLRSLPDSAIVAGG